MFKKNNFIVGFVLIIIVSTAIVPFIDGDDMAAFLGDEKTWLVGLTALFIILAFVATLHALDSIKYYVMRQEGKLPPEEMDEEVEVGDDFFTRLWKKIQDAKPIERESEIELDHEYDGIRELDNNLPPWWLWGFYLSIAFAVIYLFRYHILQTAPLSEGEYQEQMAQAEFEKAEYLKNAANLVDETSVTLLMEEGPIKEGAAIFSKNCAVCHQQDGGGGVGPNLTDEYWIHGGSIKDVFATVKYGVPAKGMIPWKDQLNPTEIQKVSSYILSLQGTSPADPKEAQGELYVPASPEPSDSLSIDEVNSETESS